MTVASGGQPRGGRRTGLLVAGAVAIALVAGVVGGVIGAVVHPAGAPGSTASGSCDVPNVTAKIMPSLVTIKVSAGRASGSGSGTVLNKQGDILTNNHVIEAAASGGDITVDFARGASAVPATIVGRDPMTDLAVIRARASQNDLNPVGVGNSGDLLVGQPVVAAGSPLGLEGTITSGVVSALSRYVEVGAGDQPSVLVNAVQTDASINPGNSGGPLLDCAGQQIGVNSAGAQVPGASGGGSIGLNFAIPMDFAMSVANQIIDTGGATHPQIGVIGVTVTSEMTNATGLPRGALVEEVLPGSGAARAGLREGDVITRVGNTGVTSVDQMIVQVRKVSIGSSVEIGYTRDGQERTVSVVVSGLSGL